MGFHESLLVDKRIGRVHLCGLDSIVEYERADDEVKEGAADDQGE